MQSPAVLAPLAGRTWLRREPLLLAAALVDKLPRDLLAQPLGFRHDVFELAQQLSELIGIER